MGDEAGLDGRAARGKPGSLAERAIAWNNGRRPARRQHRPESPLQRRNFPISRGGQHSYRRRMASPARNVRPVLFIGGGYRRWGCPRARDLQSTGDRRRPIALPHPAHQGAARCSEQRALPAVATEPGATCGIAPGRVSGSVFMPFDCNRAAAGRRQTCPPIRAARRSVSRGGTGWNPRGGGGRGGAVPRRCRSGPRPEVQQGRRRASETSWRRASRAGRQAGEAAVLERTGTSDNVSYVRSGSGKNLGKTSLFPKSAGTARPHETRSSARPGLTPGSSNRLHRRPLDPPSNSSGTDSRPSESGWSSGPRSREPGPATG